MHHKNTKLFIVIFLALSIISTVFLIDNVSTSQENTKLNTKNYNFLKSSNYDQYSKGNFSDFICSNYTLSVSLNETTDSVLGNLSVDYYNNDPVAFDRLPFHLYVYGMRYYNQPGNIEIFNVTTLIDPKTELDYNVLPEEHVMWVNLSSSLDPGERTQFKIEFNITLPDGGYDRSNVNGTDFDHNRIYKFANSYPMPCVYDKYDGWNIDLYYNSGDPFYFDMVFYNFYIEVPNEMIVAATGDLISVLTVGTRKIIHYDPYYPVREVTFSASKWFQVESEIFNGVNVSTYFLPEDNWLWNSEAITKAKNAIDLFNTTFGIYPYKTLNVVEEYSWAGGMEYPCQVYVASSIKYWGGYGPEFYLELVIVHEVGHQWFYQLVGNDEVDWAFLDEGLTIWITDYYRDIHHPDWDLLEPHYYLELVREYFLNNGLPSKINQSIEEFFDSSNNYVYATYRKAPVIFDYLRKYLGMSDFLRGLNLFVKQFYFKIATLKDLQECFESIAGYSLDWYFLPWFNNGYLPSYSFTDIVYNAETQELNLTIVDLNEETNEYTYSQLVPLVIYRYTTVIYNTQIWLNSTTKLIFSLTDTPTKVELLYTDDVLVQFSENDQAGISSTDIEVISKNNGKMIQSYPVYLLLTLIVFFGLIEIRRIQKKI